MTSSQSQEKSSGNYRTPTQYKKETECTPEDEAASRLDYAQKQWQQMQEAEECEQRSGHRRVGEKHSAKSPPPRKRRKASTMHHDGDRGRSAEYDCRGHGEHGRDQSYLHLAWAP